MFNKKGQELISKFKTLTDFIEGIAKTGDENAALILDELNSFGRILVEYVLECSNEISKLNAKNIELEEDVKELNEKLELLEKAVPKKDYQYYAMLAQKKYKKYWFLMEEKSKTFIITAMYVFNLIQAHSGDFSAIVLEYAKSIEEELAQKIYINFVKEQSKKPLLSNKSKLTDSVERYQNKQLFFLELSMMFVNFRKPNFHSEAYWCYLHQKLHTDGWQMDILTDENFITDGKYLAEYYRNRAAHNNIITAQDAIDCSSLTKNLMYTFLSAYPKK